jgi:hypothetical protein
VRDEVSTACKTTIKIILISKCLEMRWEDKIFCEFSLLLVSSWMLFSLVAVVTKYVNCATFS